MSDLVIGELGRALAGAEPGLAQAHAVPARLGEAAGLVRYNPHCH
ncbi:hypothetical protein [Niveispirillum irakense]|nr:hypothetical protein [Niveispirillum irakense]